MSKFSGGWQDLQNSDPIDVTDFVSYAQLNANLGTIMQSSAFFTPTGGTWVASPITYNIPPAISAVNGIQFPDQAMLASAASMQTQMSNPSAPPSLNHLLFLYGNDADSYLFQSRVFLNLGALNYDLVQLSILANAATKGNQHGTVQVFDFGTGPYTGIVSLTLMFCGYYGPLNLGIRLESTTNLSSVFDLDTIILPIDNSDSESDEDNEQPSKMSEH